MSSDKQDPDARRPLFLPEVFPGSDAPEVVREHDGLQVATSDLPIPLPRDSEGLQHFSDDPSREKETSEAGQRAAQDRIDGGKWSRSICGLRRTTFWLVLALAVVIIGAAVGGGVGGALSAKNKTASTTLAASSATALPETASSTSTTPSLALSATQTYSTVTSGTTGIANFYCNTTFNASYTTPSGATFMEHCYVDWPAGGPIVDLQLTTAYSFQECMQACAAYKAGGGDICTAVTYQANLTAAITGQGAGYDGNCFLKSSQGVDDPYGDLTASAELL